MVAIIFNIPIAVSGLANSHRLIIWIVVLALGANIAAAYENVLVFSAYDAIPLLNRGLAALSFLIVGLMTLLRTGAVDEVEHLAHMRRTAERERALRRFVSSLSELTSADDLLRQVGPRPRSAADKESVQRLGEALHGLAPLLQRALAGGTSRPDDARAARDR